MISKIVKTLFRFLLKAIALGVAALALYLSLLHPDTKPEDRTWLLFAGLLFLVLFFGSFFTSKCVEFPVGVVFSLMALQGAITGSFPNIFRSHRGPIDIAKEPVLFWYAMTIAVTAAIAMFWHAYHQHQKDTANNCLPWTGK